MIKAKELIRVKEMDTKPQVTETEAGVMKEVEMETEVVTEIEVETKRVVTEIEAEIVKEVARETEEVMRESGVEMETVSRTGNEGIRERRTETTGAAVASMAEINIGTSTNINIRNLIAKDNRLNLSLLT